MPEIEPGAFREELFTPKQLGKRWNLSTDYIRRRFTDESGVKKFHGNKPGKRQYVTLRIPASVAARVYAGLSHPLECDAHPAYAMQNEAALSRGESRRNLHAKRKEE